VTERETDERVRGEDDPRCPECGMRNRAGDRYCANCGTSLSPSARAPALALDQHVSWTAAPGVVAPSPAGEESTPELSRTTSPDHRPSERESAAWVLGARPAAVIGGGLLLLLLAVALLAIGQRDRTGTIVMLSICIAPLGLLTLAIGVARYLAGTAALRGERGNEGTGEETSENA